MILALRVGSARRLRRDDASDSSSVTLHGCWDTCDRRSVGYRRSSRSDPTPHKLDLLAESVAEEVLGEHHHRQVRHCPDRDEGDESGY